MSSPLKIVVAAATFNRPKGLALLLDRIEELRFDGETPAIAIAIIDNSIDGNARAYVEGRRASYRWPLHYAHQDLRGIAQARNMALDKAAELDADWMAFIDDDEYPEPQWLDRMLLLASRTGATVVVGTLEPDFDTPPPRWIVSGNFLRIHRYDDGADLDFGNTSNVLFDFRFVRQHAIRFDLAFALTGGEDTLFFEEVQAKGGRIVFSRLGIVHETIVTHRATFGWLVKRWVRSGNTDGRIVMTKKPGARGRIVDVLGGGATRLAVGAGLALATSPLALVGRGHVPAEHMRVASRGLGFILSGLGSTIEEYRQTKR